MCESQKTQQKFIIPQHDTHGYTLMLLSTNAYYVKFAPHGL